MTSTHETLTNVNIGFTIWGQKQGALKNNQHTLDTNKTLTQDLQSCGRMVELTAASPRV